MEDNIDGTRRQVPMKVVGMLPITRKRALMRTVRNKFGAKIVATPSQIIIALELRNNKSNYIFDLVAKTALNALDKPLKERDAFIGDNLGYFIAKSLPANLGKAKFHTYPNGVVFGAQAPELECLYAASLSTTVNKSIILEEFRTRVMRFVPEVQETATTLDNGSMADGMVELDPNLIINGRNACQVQVDLPEGVFAYEDLTTPNWLVIVLDGMLINGGADILKRESDNKKRQ